MTEEQSYTTEEISKLLKISKLTVYDLIKKGDLVAYRVGKQMRIDATDLEAYKRRSKQLQSSGQRIPTSDPISASGSQPGHGEFQGASLLSANPAGSAHAIPPASSTHIMTVAPRHLVITGQDVSLDILMRHMEKQTRDIRPLRSFMGSLGQACRCIAVNPIWSAPICSMEIRVSIICRIFAKS